MVDGEPAAVWLERFRATHHIVTGGARQWCTYDGRPQMAQPMVLVQVFSLIAEEVAAHLAAQRGK